MDLPNVTLFFQMFHFFLAYCILRWLVIVPAFRILNSQEAHLKNLYKKIDQTVQAEQERLKEQMVRWAFLKNSLYASLPDTSLKACVTGRSVFDFFKGSDWTLSSFQKGTLKEILYKELVDVKK